jgi:hypothetical protein
MSVSAKSIQGLLAAELRDIDDPRVTEHIQSLLVHPEPQVREWDYGEPGTAYPCWMVLANPRSKVGIAYCEHGFGPRAPWGLLFLEGGSMGMDSGWFEHFLQAYFESSASELPIWRVFRNDGSGFPGTPISDEASWDETWKEVEHLRREKPDLRFDCWQSVYPHLK